MELCTSGSPLDVPGTPNFGAFGPFSEDVAIYSDEPREDCEVDTDADDWLSPGDIGKAINSKKGNTGSAEDTDAEALERCCGSGANKSLCVVVAMLSGADLGTFEVDLDGDDPLQGLRQKLLEASGMPVRQQKLVHGASVIESSHQLKALDHDACLVLVSRLIPFIATGSVDATVRLWNSETFACEKTLKGHSDWVRSVAFSADGQKLLTASEDRSVRLWDLNTGDSVKTMQGHNQAVQCAAFSPDGALVATASDDVVARIWDTESGELRQTLSGHRKWVLTVAFSPDGQRCITASRDGQLRRLCANFPAPSPCRLREFFFGWMSSTHSLYANGSPLGVCCTCSTTGGTRGWTRRRCRSARATGFEGVHGARC